MATALYLFINFLSFDLFHSELFALEPLERIDVPCTAYEVISFNDQGQLPVCDFTCAEGKRSARVSMI